ncbi:MAG: hypothetical protein ACYTGC_11465, partial [Planctomycetota bacterium]
MRGSSEGGLRGGPVARPGAASRRRRRSVAPAVRPRRGPLAVALVAAACLAAAAGQELELGGSDRGPPRLGTRTHAGDLAATLEAEIAERLKAWNDASPAEQPFIRAKINLRVIAADLLTVGNEADREGSVAVLAGLTLADGREALEVLLDRVGAGDASNRPRRAVQRFNDEAVRHAEGVRTHDPEELDRRLPKILSGLAELLPGSGSDAVQSHWPVIALPSEEAPAGAAPLDPVVAIDRLEQRVSTAALDEQTVELVRELTGVLRRAEQFAEMRGPAREYRARLERMIDLSEAVEAATWLDQQRRSAFARRMHEALLLFRDPATRERGELRLDRLERSRRFIERISALGDRAEDLQPVREAFHVGDALLDRAGEAEQGMTQLATLANVVTLMLRYRELEPFAGRAKLQTAYRQLDRRYLDAERNVLEELQAIAGSADAAADPAVASLLIDQQQTLHDLELVHSVPRWVDVMSLVHPPSSRAFSTRFSTMAGGLLDPSRRDDAIATMDEFQVQLERFYPLPFERELRSGDPLAAQATGGFNDRSVAEIDRRRGEWA